MNGDIWNGNVRLEKSLYDQYLEKMQSAYPTNKQMFVGQICFWVLVCIGSFFALHMAFTTLNFVFYTIFMCLSFVLFNLMILRIFTFMHSYLEQYKENFVIPNKYLHDNILPYSIMNFVFNTIFALNFLFKYRFWVLIPTIIHILLFIICLCLITVYEIKGWYVDISQSISILDMIPNAWQYSSGNVSKEPYSFINTLYVILYYSFYILLFLYGLIYACAFFVWRKNFLRLLLDKKTEVRVKMYIKKNPEIKTRGFKMWGLGMSVFFLIIFLICVPAFGELVFVEDTITIFYEFNFSYGAYGIIHPLFFTVVAFYALLECVSAIRFATESKYYIKYF